MKTPSVLIKYFRRKRNQGIATVYVALLLVALLAFVGLAIDLGYMYLTKTQLQNAADSAALAGASILISSGAITNLSDQRITDAKNEAINFALQNKAAGDNIVILSDGTNTLSDTNDVTVGFWDGSNYTPNTTPVNALKARPRRTENSPGGKVAIFFGEVIGISEMAASADAVAALPLRAGIYIALCINTCSGCTATPCLFPDGKQYETGPIEPYDYKFAWTTLLENPTAANKLEKLMCKDTPMQNVCGKDIWATMGGPTSTLRDMESAFYNINLDASNKEFTIIDENKVVTGWNVIVPITEHCPPGAEGSAYDPKRVSHYAKLHISAICATGAASGCWGTPPNIKDACKDGVLPAKNCCENFSNNVIVIDSIQCVSCTDESIFSGTKPSIVE